MKKPAFLLTLFIAAVLLLSGCGGKNEKTSGVDDQVLTVYTTVYPLQYFTERIGGEFVDSKTIYPPGVDEHTYEPTQKDMIKLADADLFIYIGLGLEGFADRAGKSLEKEHVVLVAAGERIDIENDGHEEEEHNSHKHGHHDEHGHHHGHIDPHLWIDPVYSRQLAEVIKNELIKQMPENEAIFTENYQSLVQDLERLDNRFKQLASQVKNKQFIVSHAAYGYWEKRYGLEQISISGISSSSEPSQKELTNIVKTAEKHGLQYIFFEQNIPSKLTEIVQEAINGEALTLHNLSVLTEEDLKKKRDYFSIMEDNLKALEKGLN